MTKNTETVPAEPKSASEAGDFREWLGGQLKELGDRNAQAIEPVQTGLNDLKKQVEDSEKSLDGRIKAIESLIPSEDPDERRERSKALFSDELGTDDPAKLEKALGFDLGMATKAIMAHRGIGNASPEQFYKSTEWECMQAAGAAAAKTVQAGSDILGGFMLPTAYLRDRMVPALRARSIAMLLGAQPVENIPGGSAEIPRQDGVTQANWKGELEQKTDTDPNYGMIRVFPHTLIAHTAITGVWLNAAAAGGVGLSPLEEDLVTSIQLKLDLAILKGDAAGGSPVGMYNASGVESVDWNSADYAGADQTVTDLLEDMIGKLEDNNADFGNLAFAMHPAVRRKLRKVKDADGKPLFEPRSNRSDRDLTANGRQVGMFYGYPFATSTQLSGTDPADLMFANFGTVMVTTFRPISIDVSKDADFRKDNVVLKAVTDVDVAIRHAKAIAVANNLDPA